jgi:hypothetical protein
MLGAELRENGSADDVVPAMPMQMMFAGSFSGIVGGGSVDAMFCDVVLNGCW